MPARMTIFGSPPRDNAWLLSRQRRPTPIEISPSPLDTWISTQLNATRDGPPLTFELSPDEVECCLIATRIHAPDLDIPDCPFGDPSISILYLTVRISPAFVCHTETLKSPRAILDYYVDYSSAHEPEWTDFDLDAPHYFRQDRGFMASLFGKLALHESNLRMPHLTFDMMNWARTTSIGTAFEADVNALCMRHGFRVDRGSRCIPGSHFIP
ncbi:hypothetical protein K474DRAFT_1666410 [Panus rudis PR-1116 ss-1]|nr:hypothetical protein K474DRAFT_1666410 [Panus rudis PR-1116 ss-1]